MKIKHAYFDKDEIRERLSVTEDEQLYVPEQAFHFDQRANMWVLEMEVYAKDEELPIT